MQNSVSIRGDFNEVTLYYENGASEKVCTRGEITRKLEAGGGIFIAISKNGTNLP